MGDSACLMHAFSYTDTSGLSEPNQGNPVHVLGESVSFGRFVSESLAWEKWSTFSHNRYVEEAERYAQPGSVAQKKAFFEAHYKRIAAAKKAAALLEQASAANDATEKQDKMEQEKAEEHEHESKVQSFEPEGIKVGETQVGIDAMDESQKKKAELELKGTSKMENAQLYLDVVSVKETSKSSKRFDNQEDTSASENSGTPQIEKPLLKNFGRNGDAPSVKSKKMSAFSSFTSSIHPKTSKVSASPAKKVTPLVKREHNPTPTTKKSTLKFVERKENQKPVASYMNSTPAKTPDRLFAPSNPKTPSSRVGSAAYKAFQACISPLRTPNMAATARISKNVPATPQSESTRMKSPRDGNKTPAPKWNILSAVCPKSLTARRNKLQSPTVSTPFTLRTEERAARRKQKLEEKFNLKETPKMQLQTKIKEKAELELRKLRRTFCFKARPLPDFYKERETGENQMKKGNATQPQPSEMGRKSKTGKFSQLTSGSSNKTSKHMNKSSTVSYYVASLAGATNHENTSPNVQY